MQYQFLKTRYKKLFPKKRCAVIFVMYMALFITQGLAVTATQNPDHKYEYNTATVVLLGEAFKLVAAIVIHVFNNSWNEFKIEIVERRKLFVLYFAPAALYCLYNNLQFTSLTWFDPTSYFVLMQFRVVITGVLFQIFFSKELTPMQWLSLILLTMGCIVQRLHENDIGKLSLDINVYLVLILIQVLSSCFAGVYTEYILKKQPGDVMIQNVYLYGNSVICNLVLIMCKGQLGDFLSAEGWAPLGSFKVCYIIINTTCIGITVSLFLKYLNSILKTFASALEIVFTAILSYVIFGVSIDFGTIISVLLIFIATYLYSANPVNNTRDGSDKANSPPLSPTTLSSKDNLESNSNHVTLNTTRSRALSGSENV